VRNRIYRLSFAIVAALYANVAAAHAVLVRGALAGDLGGFASHSRKFRLRDQSLAGHRGRPDHCITPGSLRCVGAPVWRFAISAVDKAPGSESATTLAPLHRHHGRGGGAFVLAGVVHRYCSEHDWGVAEILESDIFEAVLFEMQFGRLWITG
jgi:hypothetical protein